VTQVVARAPIASFVVVAYAISWGIWAPLVFGPARLSGPVAWAIYYSGVIGPAAAAFVCAALGSCVTPAALLRRLTRWRVPFAWYATAVLLPFAIRGVAVAGVALFEGASWRMAVRPAETIGRIAVLMVLLVPFEEIGWRGYVLPLLQRQYTPLVSSIILGGIWALWHLPLAWASVGHQRSDEPWRYMACFVATIIPVSCLVTWLFNRTGESVLLVSLLHIAINMADFVLVLPPRAGELILLAGSLVTALVVAAAWRRDGRDRQSSS
jgi:CAAX protease family protein